MNASSSINTKHILLTIDVEDWFQVENFRQWNPHSTWDSRELRVEKNVHRLLDLFDSIKLIAHSSKLKEPNNSTDTTTSISLRNEIKRGTCENFRQGRIASSQFLPEIEKAKESNKSSRSCQTNEITSNPFQPYSKEANIQPPRLPTFQLPSLRKPKATFFVLGWLAERLPHMVREIQARGHEVASHGYNHEMPNSLSLSDLKDDLIKSKKLLEDIIGAAVTGYRAPSFAINDDILETIGECGYHYDSSYNSFSLHGRYGHISLNGSGRNGSAHRISENFHELPISNLPLSTLGILAQFRQFRHFQLPMGGGAYFRLAPYSLFRRGIKSILKTNNAYLFYLHPWELDPNQPRMKQASLNFKFRHYINLNKTETRLRDLIESFDRCRFVTCRQYLSIQSTRGNYHKN